MTAFPHLESLGARPNAGDPPAAIWARLSGNVRHETEWILASIAVHPRRARTLWRHGQAVCGDAPSMLWLEPEGREHWIALGSATALDASGPSRVESATKDAERLLSKVESLTLPGYLPIPPRLVGGLAFAPGTSRGDVWQDFPEVGFTLPRWFYMERDGQAYLTHAFHVRELRLGATPTSSSGARWGSGAPWRRLLAAAAALQVLPDDGIDAAPQRLTLTFRESPNESAWTERVNRLRVEFLSGRLRKVVLARHTTLTLDGSVDIAWLIGRLEQESPGCTVFAIRRGLSTFLGATPEWLFRLAGRTLESEALAGSCAGVQAPETLLASAKDRAEHALVVSGLLEALAPIATSISYAREPDVMRLRHLLHLRTPISARLRARHHPLELVGRLHPTPAVGGSPTPSALKAIREFEGAQRGWYAAPLGWFDANDTARFIVGLRSGVVSGNKAHVFAGAGIMPDSKAALESAEVRLKQRAFLRALGVEA